MVDRKFGVAPFAGAWIEIAVIICLDWPLLSLPSRERGLKYAPHLSTISHAAVAPFAGAWIEIAVTRTALWQIHCRSLRGSVD